MRRLPLVTHAVQLEKLCDILDNSSVIAFDTEFVPEYTYQPQLCLLQVATDEVAAAIDPLKISDLERFWELLTSPDREVIVHAGSAELNFCHRATGQLPPKMVDVQIAAGFLGYNYPIGYKALLQRALDIDTSSMETRTDWRRRPLSDDQIKYALDDVIHLLPLREKLVGALTSSGRLPWFMEEVERSKRRVLSRASEEPWRRVSGAGSLSRRELAILAEIAHWRNERAKQHNKPIKQVMRDDIIVELARRKPRSHEAMGKLRGMSRYKRDAPELLDAVREGLETPTDECPRVSRRRSLPGEKMILKLLSAVMADLAEEHEIASTLLGTKSDLQDLMDWHSSRDNDNAPRLASDWRAKMCGEYLTSFLAGEMALGLDTKQRVPRLTFVPTK